jgi:hypothetical protein
MSIGWETANLQVFRNPIMRQKQKAGAEELAPAFVSLTVIAAPGCTVKLF